MITKQVEKLLQEHINNYYRNNTVEQYIEIEDYLTKEEAEEAIESSISEVKNTDMETESENYCFDNWYNEGYQQALRDAIKSFSIN